MKNIFFSLAFILIGSFSFAHTKNIEVMATRAFPLGIIDAAEDAVPPSKQELPAACWIVFIHVTCGGTYQTQYCTDGLHGTVQEWVDRINAAACN
jgi:hypothetical protein